MRPSSNYLCHVYFVGVGTADCPWLLRAGEGQRISLSLLDFSAANRRSSVPSSAENEALPKPPPSSQRCVRLAVVREVSAAGTYRRSDREICSVRPGDGGRERSVYLSASNELEVMITRRTSADDDDDADAIFLLRYDGMLRYVMSRDKQVRGG